MNRLDFFTVTALLFATIGTSKAMNVLFIMVDDLRPELSFFAGERSNLYSGISTPNIDALASKSLVLKRAYVQQAVCGPSRASILTGRRPDSTRVHTNDDSFRDTGNFSTIPEFFKDNGYISAGMGKIFHNGGGGNHDDLQSWSTSEYAYFHPLPRDTYREDKTYSWNSVSDSDLGTRQLEDVLLAEKANSTLEDFSSTGTHANENFFIAVGFHKPHLAFWYMDDYEISGTVGLADNPYNPTDMPNEAWNGCGELQQYADIQAEGYGGTRSESVSDTKAEELRKAYFGAIMWIDSLVGGVIQKVTDLGLENDTIIALMGDHGWHLGEHNFWCKQTNYEESAWAPLMFHIPGQTDAGISSSSIVEFVDIFPTLVEAAGLGTITSCPENSTEVRTCTDGKSLIPLITNSSEVIKEFAMTQNTRKRDGGATEIMGYTIRTTDFRYTEWTELSGGYANWTTVANRHKELYDLINDPRENTNVAGNSTYSTDETDLQTKLRNAVYVP